MLYKSLSENAYFSYLSGDNLALCMIFTNVLLFVFQQLIDNLDRDLQYAIRVEGKMDLEIVSNYDDVKNAIMEKVLPLSAVKHENNVSTLNLCSPP